MAMTTSRVLERGLERLQDVGWVQGDYIHTEPKHERTHYGHRREFSVVGFCMVGALATRTEVTQHNISCIGKPWRRQAMIRLAEEIHAARWDGSFADHSRECPCVNVPIAKWGTDEILDYIASWNDGQVKDVAEVLSVYKAAITKAQHHEAVNAAKRGAAEGDLAVSGD